MFNYIKKRSIKAVFFQTLAYDKQKTAERARKGMLKGVLTACRMNTSLCFTSKKDQDVTLSISKRAY